MHLYFQENNNFMTTLNKQNIQDILDRAPSDIPTEEILSGLIERGYKLEGYNDKVETQPTAPPKETALVGVAKGAAKEIGNLVQGATNMAIKNPITNPAALVEKIAPNSKIGKAQKMIVDTINSPSINKALEANTPAQKVGKGITQIAEFAIPQSKVAKATEGLNIVQKVLTKAITSSAVATAQNKGEVGKGTVIAAGAEVGFPVAGVLLKNLLVKPLSGIIKGLGSAFSGGSVEDINNILKDPKTAEQVTKAFSGGNGTEVLKKEAQKIMDGVSLIKKQASNAYKEGLNSLESIDIKPEIIKNNVTDVINKYGGQVKKSGISLSGTQFSTDKNLVKKANDIISKINNTKDLSGRAIRQLMEDIDTNKLKTATNDTSISFNELMGDLSSSLKKSVSESTNKLDEINASYSKDAQLADSIQNIFGKVKFKNPKELAKIASKIEALSYEKGLSPETIDTFFKRINQSAQEFKTSESTRKMLSQTGQRNSIGGSFAEITRNLGAGIITPKLITQIATLTGKTEPYLKALLQKTEPALRASVIKSLIPSKE